MTNRPQSAHKEMGAYAPSNRWIVAGVGGMLASLMAAGCTSHASRAAAPPPSQPASTATASTPAPSPTASAPAGVQNLLVPPAVRRDMTATYLAYMHFKPAGIAGTAPNSVYYAYDPASGTYWAMATFVASQKALRSSPGSPLYQVLVNMQDGGNQGLFTRTSGGAWQMQTAGVPPQCQIFKFFPKAVITVWALPLPPCPASG
jgi:hypothetical protein